jgi:endoribonuclease Dicer
MRTRQPFVANRVEIGTQSVSSTLANMSLREQVLTLQKFRNGEINCLFATSVAEEGIDVPECDLIIRFDLYDTVIQYIQSKGRARQVRSRYINMLEEGNLREIRRLKQADRDSIALKNFCAAVPEDRKVQDCVVDAAAVAEAERLTQKVHEISSTGARLSLQNSMEVLAKFVASFSSESSSTLVPEYAVISEGRKFSADVILPEVCPVNCVSGFPQRSKQLAKYSAAFEACMMLLEKNYLSDNLQPVFVKKLPAMRNARLAVSSRKKAEYAMRVKPNVWSRLGTWNGVDVYPVALVLENPDAFGRPSRPLILLCRQRLPSIPPVPLFFGKNTKSISKVVASQTQISLSEFQIDALTVFTLRVYQDIFSKWYEASSEDMPYLLAPSADSHRIILETGGINIDWDITESIYSKGQEYLDWKNQPRDFFKDRFVVDPVDGSRKMFTHLVNANLNPSDSIPTDCADPAVTQGKLAGKTIKQYTSGFQSKARREKQWSDHQPVIESELLSLRRNFLDPHYPEETNDNLKCYIIPEPLLISPVCLETLFAMSNLTNFAGTCRRCIHGTLVSGDFASNGFLLNCIGRLLLLGLGHSTRFGLGSPYKRQ